MKEISMRMSLRAKFRADNPVEPHQQVRRRSLRPSENLGDTFVCLVVDSDQLTATAASHMQLILTCGAEAMGYSSEFEMLGEFEFN